MNISVHATHRLPFFNATVTAKQLSSSTTPVAFKLATGEEIGFEIRTNARGFICRTDGTPYNDGVFVGEDAIVTATLGDGSSTSWTVTSESEIVIFDGILYGREAEPGDHPDTLVRVGDKYYKKLFSANQEPNSQLSLNDLADVPSFTKWTDDQQIETIDFNNVRRTHTVTVGLQTKVLILKATNDDVILGSDVAFKLILQPTLAEDGKSSRFGRNVVITNNTLNRVVLYNQNAPYPFGGIDSFRSVTVSETYPNAQSSGVGGTATFACTQSGLFLSGSNHLKIGSDRKLVLTDGCSDYIIIGNVLSVGDIARTVSVDVDATDVLLNRRVTLRRMDSFSGTLRLTNNATGIEIGFMLPYSTIELIIGRNHAVAVDEHIAKASSARITLSESVAQYPEIPVGCTLVHVDCGGNTSKTELHKILVNPHCTDTVRMEFSNAPAPIWVAIVNSEHQDFIAEQFCIPAGNSRVCVQLIHGAAKVLEKNWTKAASEYHNTGNHEYILKYNTFDITFDLSDIAIRDRAYGTDLVDHMYDAIAAFPINSGESAYIRMKMPFYAATGGGDNGDCRFGIGGHDNTFTISNGSTFSGGQQTWYDKKFDENWFQLAGHIVEGILTRVGTTYSFQVSKVYALE